jgi:hypothetical protein
MRRSEAILTRVELTIGHRRRYCEPAGAWDFSIESDLAGAGAWRVLPIGGHETVTRCTLATAPRR